MKNLQVGDVFKMKKGMQAYLMLPECEVYSNTPTSQKLTETNRTLDAKSKYIGEYVVIRTSYDGGSFGGGMNGHDDYPNGHRVYAQKLNKQGKYDDKGLTLNFYQSGCFNAMNTEVPAVRVMKMSFT